MSIPAGFEHIVRENEPLAPYTWFRLGGPAQYFAEPTNVEELAALVRRCHEADLPVRILGGGSNLLVRDEGVSGVVASGPPQGEARMNPTIQLLTAEDLWRLPKDGNRHDSNQGNPRKAHNVTRHSYFSFLLDNK